MKYILITFFLFFQLAWASADKELHTDTWDMSFHKPSQTRYLGENLCVHHNTEEYLCLPNAISKSSHEVVDSIPQDVWEDFQKQVSQYTDTWDMSFHKPSQTRYLGENLCVHHNTEEYLCLPNAISKSSYEVVDSIPQDVWEDFQKQVSQVDYRVVEQ